MSVPHIILLSWLSVLKIGKFGENLTTFWQKQVGSNKLRLCYNDNENSPFEKSIFVFTSYAYC